MKKNYNYKKNIPRKAFLKNAALATAGIWILPRHVLGGKGFVAPSDKLLIAAIGTGGEASNDIDHYATAPKKNAEIAFISKYVSRQYLDNTSTKSRSLDGYMVNDVRLNYNFSIKGIKNVGLGLLINNVFSKKYQSDGATYPDIEGGKVVNYNYFFPQAPTNFLLGVNVKF